MSEPGEHREGADGVRCPSCEQQSVAGRYCVRCGAPLADGPIDVRRRREFAAAPGQRRLVPWLVSTLFPHLPHRSTRDLRVALVLGTALVAALAALRLFGVAIISAALLLPLITALYFYDVDIYESEPWWATAWTFVWGAVTGAGVGLLANVLAPRGAALIDKGSTAHVVTGGILLPALGVVLMLAGPLVLLRHRRFNEVLDGATFGAAAAATFAAAEAVVVGAHVLAGGLRPTGAAAPWVARLVTLAVATPVLSMSAIGAAVAAVWLRHRAPAGDRGALGILGRPPVAIATAAVLVIAGAVGETFMAVGLWLATVVALDLIGLVMLRRAVHLGLLEEAAEIEIGPALACANCGAQTARHTFCAHCGIALRALPKARAGERGTVPGRLHPEGAGARASGRWLVAFVLGTGAVIGVAVVVALAVAPSPRQAVCRPQARCGAPPVLPRLLASFPGYTPWQSSQFGFSLRFNDDDWQIAQQTAGGVELETSDHSSVLFVQGVAQSQLTPVALLGAEAASLKGKLLGFATDTKIADQLLGSGVGLRPGAGGVYAATVSTPQGPAAPVAIAIQTAGDGRVSIAAVMVTPADSPQAQAAAYQRADDVIDSVEWGSG